MNEEAVKRAVARSHIFRFLSHLFLYPEEKTLAGLNWEEGEEAVAILGNPNGLKEAFESLRSSLKEPVDIQSEYVRIFGHTLGDICPPYETQNGGTHIFQQAQDLGDIAGFYRAFGLEVSDQTKERLDHISIELEFMAFLAYKRAYALASDEKENAEVCREAQRKFMNDHLGRWAPDFTRRLEFEAKDGFYERLAVLTERFLTFEVEAFGVQPLKVEELAPIPFEPEGGCFSCEIRGRFPGEGSS